MTSAPKKKPDDPGQSESDKQFQNDLIDVLNRIAADLERIAESVEALTDAFEAPEEPQPVAPVAPEPKDGE